MTDEWSASAPPHRPRRPGPALPTGELILEPPPAIPPATGARWQQWLAVLPMLAGTAATAMMFGGRDGASTYTYLVGAIFGLSTLGLLVTNWGGASGARKAELMRARRDYLRYLAGVRRRVYTVMREQRLALCYRHPEPGTLWAQTLGERVFQRRPSDGDFAVVRVGLGPQALATTLVAPVVDATAELEPVTAGALRRFIDTYSVVPDLPVCVAVAAFRRVVVTGAEPGRARALTRAMLAQLATFHAPTDLLIGCCVAPNRRRDWEWVKWLPHALHPSASDAAGPRRLVAQTWAELEPLLAEAIGASRLAPTRPTPAGAGWTEPLTPHTIVVVDGVPAPPVATDSSGAALTLLEIATEPTAPTAPVAVGACTDRSTIVLSIDAGGGLRSHLLDQETEVGRADTLTLAEAESLARQLAPRGRVAAEAATAASPAGLDLAELLGLPDLASADVHTLWAPRRAAEALRVPIGVGAAGEAVHLDLKEAADGGMGPHGLVVGATGSGKSELLRTIVLGLAVTHPPDRLNFVLVDFKGGATFASLDRLPHTAAVITNLADELPLVDRMNDAMSGELTRRQELLRRAGNAASLREYGEARAARADLAPLPSLLLVCDEFTEMLTAKPDFIDLFLQIGRIGRSIGVHLLLATQRLEEGRLRGLETNLSYRIALRTFSATESRLALGSTAAAELPSAPGHAFLRVGTAEPRRFKAAYVSGPQPTGPQPTGRHAVGRRGPATGAPAARVLDYTTQHLPVPPDPAPAQPPPARSAPDPAGGESLLRLVVGRLRGQGQPAHQVWLAPLGSAPSLDELLGPLRSMPARGLSCVDSAHWGALRVPVAVVDKPFEQRRDVAWLDLAGSAGHVAIVGTPQSGKSTAVRTMVTALALTHTPREAQVYCLDFGGGALASLRELPHVGIVAGRTDTASVRRTVGEVAALLTDRERRFGAYGIDSVSTFRRLRRPTELDATLVLPEDGFGDVFLIVDGWSTLRIEYEDLEPVLVDIATRGLSYGIHVIATALRWSDFRASSKDLFASRVELRLGDASESLVNRRDAANVPPGVPGRGLTEPGLHLLTALPQASGQPPAQLIAAIAAAWVGPAAPPVRMLPTLLPYAELLVITEDGARRPLGAGLALPLGVAEADLRPVLADFDADAHLVAFGDAGCGKSSLLRALAESITRRCRPDQARIVIIDYRRSLLGAVGSEHLIGYGSTADNTAALVESVAAYLDRRRPGPDVTPEQLRGRSWWRGPECFVLVDDYDLLADGPAHPLLPLLDHLAQARDVGLHLILTRRAGGAGRALYEPLLQRLRELGTPGLVLDGDRDEGALVGAVRPGPQPPGRGWLVTRAHGARLVQLAYLDPP